MFKVNNLMKVIKERKTIRVKEALTANAGTEHDRENWLREEIIVETK